MSRPKLTTERGYDFFEVASALQKALRRADTKYAGYFALELFPRYHKYVWKRLLTVCAEDKYGILSKEIKALHDSFLYINEGKKRDQMGGRVFISKAVVLISEAKGNRDADLLSNYVYDRNHGIDDDKMMAYFDEVREENLDIPEYAYDVHTLKGKRMGKTVEDMIVDEQLAMANEQTSLFHIPGVTDLKNNGHNPVG